MTNKIIYIDISSNRVVGSDGSVLMTKPSLIYGSAPYLEFHIVQGSSSVDVSEATSWQASIDTDFNLTTDPMTRSIGTDIDSTYAEDGIIVAHVNTNTQKFQDVVSGKDSVNANLELRGFDSNGYTIYCIRFAIQCWGAVDLIALSSVPIPDNIASISYVTAVTSGFQRQVNTLQTNFDDLEDVVYDLSSTVLELSSVTDLSSQVQTNSNNISTISSAISGIPTLSTTVGINTSNISTLSTNVGTLSADVIYISGEIQGLTPSGMTELQQNVRTLSGGLSGLSTTVNDHIANTIVHVTAAEKAIWDAKSSFDGNYNNLSNRPDLTIYETTVSANATYDYLSGKIDEVSGKLPTTTGGVPVTYVKSDYSYVAGEDTGKIVFLDEDEGESYLAIGEVDSNFKHTLSGQNSYMVLSTDYSVPGTTTKVNDLTLYSQPASGVTFTGTCDGTSRSFVYYGTYLNSRANVRFPIWKDSGSSYYLYPGTCWDGNWEWSIASYLPTDGTNPYDYGLYYSSAKFDIGSLLHPKVEDFNNSNWSYDDGPYNRTVSMTQGGSYPTNDVLTDYLSCAFPFLFDTQLTMSGLTIGSGTIAYTDQYTMQDVTVEHYTATFIKTDDYPSGYPKQISFGMAYNNGTQGTPGTYIKMQITSHDDITAIYGKYGTMPLTGTNWPTVLTGEYRDLANISGWSYPSASYEGTILNMISAGIYREGNITTTTPGTTVTKVKFARIPIELPEELVYSSDDSDDSSSSSSSSSSDSIPTKITVSGVSDSSYNGEYTYDSDTGYYWYGTVDTSGSKFIWRSNTTWFISNFNLNSYGSQTTNSYSSSVSTSDITDLLGTMTWTYYTGSSETITLTDTSSGSSSSSSSSSSESSSSSSETLTGPYLSVTGCSTTAVNGNYYLYSGDATSSNSGWKHATEEYYIWCATGEQYPKVCIFTTSTIPSSSSSAVATIYYSAAGSRGNYNPTTIFAGGTTYSGITTTYHAS